MALLSFQDPVTFYPNLAKQGISQLYVWLLCKVVKEKHSIYSCFRQLCWVGRYKSPDEHLFFPYELLDPLLPLLQYPQDRKWLMELLTHPSIEESIKKRVELVARTYGLVVPANTSKDGVDSVCKINPSLVADLYDDRIMPLTKEVQVNTF